MLQRTAQALSGSCRLAPFRNQLSSEKARQSEWKPRDHETFVTQRGAAIKEGKVVRGTGDGYLLALDSKTGKELWSRHIANPAEGYFRGTTSASRFPR